MVLVLVPGGSFWMGAAPLDAHNDDPLAEAINEGPVHEVRLAPFLIAKFECTQSQWQRVTGTNPSVHSAISIHVDDDRAPLDSCCMINALFMRARNLASSSGDTPSSMSGDAALLR